MNAHTGHYAWHYQEVPAEEWDYDCTAPLILADLKIGGKKRQVVDARAQETASSTCSTARPAS